MRQVNTVKDLGVMLSSDLKVASQCAEAYNTANRTLGMIKRTIQFKDKSVLLQLYKSLVRPHLEYCSPVWSPYYIKDRSLLEKVQRRFTRLLPGMKELDYEERLSRLGLWTLEERRNRADLIEVKTKDNEGIIVHSIPLDRFFRISSVSRTRGHTLKLIK